VKYLITIALLIVLSTGVCAQIYPIDRLYAGPDIESPVVFIIPYWIQLHVLERRGDWVQLQIKWDFFGNKGDVTGWIFIRRINYDVL